MQFIIRYFFRINNFILFVIFLTIIVIFFYSITTPSLDSSMKRKCFKTCSLVVRNFITIIIFILLLENFIDITNILYQIFKLSLRSTSLCLYHSYKNKRCIGCVDCSIIYQRYIFKSKKSLENVHITTTKHVKTTCQTDEQTETISSLKKV